MVRSGTQVTASLLESAPHLRVIGRAGTGVDNIDVPAATRRGIVVLNTPGGNSVAACEQTFALLLAVFRNLPAASAHLATGSGMRKRFAGRQLAGKTLGLLGFGRIGREVAVRARAFDMEVLVVDPFVTDTLAREWEARLVDREELLAPARRGELASSPHRGDPEHRGRSGPRPHEAGGGLGELRSGGPGGRSRAPRRLEFGTFGWGRSGRVRPGAPGGVSLGRASQGGVHAAPRRLHRGSATRRGLGGGGPGPRLSPGR